MHVLFHFSNSLILRLSRQPTVDVASALTMSDKSSPPSRHPSFEDEDESVRIAVSALGDMRSGGRTSASGEIDLLVQ